MADVIEGRVAKILDEYTLIINVGAAQGVWNGMRFVVFAQGDEVLDPDSGESLGRWEAVKGHVVASHVQDRLTVCTAAPAAKETDDDPSTRTLSAAMIADHMRQANAEGKLVVNKGQIDGMPKTGPISVGDPVRSVSVE